MKFVSWLFQRESAVLGTSLLLLLFCGALREEAPNGRDGRGPASAFTCEMHTKDVGDVMGHGADKDGALADAIQQCYLRHEAKYEHDGKKIVDIENGEKMATDCANLICKYQVSTL